MSSVSFIMSLSTADLSHGELTSAGTSRDSCHVQEHLKRDTLHNECT